MANNIEWNKQMQTYGTKEDAIMAAQDCGAKYVIRDARYNCYIVADHHNGGEVSWAQGMAEQRKFAKTLLSQALAAPCPSESPAWKALIREIQTIDPNNFMVVPAACLTTRGPKASALQAARTFAADKQGTTAIEYATITAIIAIVVAAVVPALGENIQAAFSFVSSAVATAGGG